MSLAAWRALPGDDSEEDENDEDEFDDEEEDDDDEEEDEDEEGTWYVGGRTAGDSLDFSRVNSL